MPRKRIVTKEMKQFAKDHPMKFKVGPPTEYREEFCEMAAQMGAEGKLLVEIAFEFGVSVKTLYNWKKQHPSFEDAMERAEVGAQAWTVQVGRKIMLEELPNNRKGNATIWKSFAANVLGYADKVDNHNDNGPVELILCEGEGALLKKRDEESKK